MEYAAGDHFVVFGEDGRGSSDFVLTSVEENEIWYTFPDLPQQAPVSMRREEFENNLRSGHIREQPESTNQPKQEEPVELHSIVIDLTAPAPKKERPSYIADDSFLVFDEAEKIQSEIQIIRITDDEITYATPTAPATPLVTMRREEFDQNLQNGRFRRKDSVPSEILEQEEQYLLGEGDILTIDGKQYALVSFGNPVSYTHLTLPTTSRV